MRRMDQRLAEAVGRKIKIANIERGLRQIDLGRVLADHFDDPTWSRNKAAKVSKALSGSFPLTIDALFVIAQVQRKPLGWYFEDVEPIAVSRYAGVAQRSPLRLVRVDPSVRPAGRSATRKGAFRAIPDHPLLQETA